MTATRLPFLALLLAAGLTGCGGDTVESYVETIYESEDSRELHSARRALALLNKRTEALDLMDSYVRQDDGNLEGKIRVVDTMIEWRAERRLEAALDAPATEARRSVASRLYGRKPYRSLIGDTMIEWIKDEGASSREQAVMVAGFMKLKKAIPAIMDVLTSEDPRLVRSAFTSLRSLEAKGIAKRAMDIVRDNDAESTVRQSALSALPSLADAKTEEVRDLMIGLVQDARAPITLRQVAALRLDRPKFAGEKTWKALEALLLKDSEELAKASSSPVDNVHSFQRNCWRSLVSHMPLDRVEELAYKLWRHPFFGIRIDVAALFGNWGLKKKKAYDILVEYLTDDDPKDSTAIVRQEAWLSLWTLSRRMYKVEQRDLFKYPPKIPIKPQRPFLLKISWSRAGVNKQMIEALGKKLGSLETMRSVAQLYTQAYGEVETAWKKDAEKRANVERERKRREEERKRKAANKDKDKDKDKGTEKKPDQPEDEGPGKEPAKKDADGEKKPEEAEPTPPGDDTDDKAGVARKPIDVIRDPKAAERERRGALKTYLKRPDLKVDEARDVLLGFLQDDNAPIRLRIVSAIHLEDPKFGGETAWGVLRKILLSDPAKVSKDPRASIENAYVLQRSCWRSLIRHSPLEDLEELASKVSRHPYLGIRVDVAALFGNWGLKKKNAYDILVGYLTDEDPKDVAGLVRQEAWLSLWILSRRMYPIEQKDLFKDPPKISTTPQRPQLLRISWSRRGVKRDVVTALQEKTADLALMKRVAQLYSEAFDEVQAMWKRDAETAREGK